MIFRLLCLLPSAALFPLTIWPFGPPPPRSPLRWRPHKELCFDWSAGLSTGVFLSIRANVRPPFYQWIPTKLTSNTTSSYSAPASVSIQLQLFLGLPSTAPALLGLPSPSFLIGELVWFIKITKSALFKSAEVFRKDPFLALYFSLHSLMILWLLPSAALFTLTIWPFGPPPPGLYCGRGHTRSSVLIGAMVWVLVSSSQSEQMWGLLFISGSPPS